MELYQNGPQLINDIEEGMHFFLIRQQFAGVERSNVCAGAIKTYLKGDISESNLQFKHKIPM